MNERTRLKTHSRLSNFYKAIHSIKTDKGQLLFRIDSPGSVPQDLESVRSEPETFEWIKSHLNENEVLWDVGANIGVFSLYAALGGKNKVLSIEPSAESYSTLNANIRLNNLEEYIDALCFAGSEETNLLQLHMKDPSSGASHNSIGSSSNQFGEFDVNGKQSVIAISLDDLDQIAGIASPNHIKLDVDGKEPEILSGATKVLKKVNSLLVEIEGKNLSEKLESIENSIAESGLREDRNWRDKGSGRNRLYKRELS
jgi:FkbM family methyltransferase